MEQDTSGYRDVFGEEAQVLLQAFGEALLELEGSDDVPELVNTLFRLIHTLKGMSSAMGFADITELTHGMESVLTLYRGGDAKPDEHVVGLLFECVDALRSMVEAHIGGGGPAVDSSRLVGDLDRFVAAATSGAAGEPARMRGGAAVGPAQAAPASAIGRALAINDHHLAAVEQARSEGFTILHVHVVLAADCRLKSARSYVVYSRLERLGEILAISPDPEDIESELFDRDLHFLLASRALDGEVAEALSTVSELTAVQVDENPAFSYSMQSAADLPVTRASAEGEEGDTPRGPISRGTESAVGKARQLASSKATIGAKSVRVDDGLLRGLLRQIGELVHSRAQLGVLADGIGNPELVVAVQQLGSRIRDVQQGLMQARMVALSTVFDRLPRMVRELARQCGKLVELDTSGGETELDRVTADAVGDALVHLIRNAVDHGIELPSERRALGKPEKGRLTLSATTEEYGIQVELADDGGGIDVERVRQAAADRGLLSPTKLKALSDAEALDVIFAPGFTTTQKVTEISGRGVGLDVVRGKIAQLEGEIKVVSQVNQGTTISFWLPAGTTIARVLVVSVSGEMCAVQVASVEDLVQVRPEQHCALRGDNTVEVRGAVVPLFFAGDLLGGPMETPLGWAGQVLVVCSEGKRIGIAVDAIIDEAEVVVHHQRLTPKGAPLAVGHAILDDGSVVTVLDVSRLPA